MGVRCYACNDLVFDLIELGYYVTPSDDVYHIHAQKRNPFDNNVDEIDIALCPKFNDRGNYNYSIVFRRKNGKRVIAQYTLYEENTYWILSLFHKFHDMIQSGNKK